MRDNGTVKFFNLSKGFGFISPDGGGKDVFVHVTAVQKSGIPELTENMKLSFEVQPDKRGRGPQVTPTKVLTSIRLDADVLEFFKSKGGGY